MKKRHALHNLRFGRKKRYGDELKEKTLAANPTKIIRETVQFKLTFHRKAEVYLLRDILNYEEMLLTAEDVKYHELAICKAKEFNITCKELFI